MDRDYKFVVSKNGKHLLLLFGFSYRKYMTSRSHSYWTCTHRNCRAKGTLSPKGEFSLTKYAHTHPPDPQEMQNKIYIAKLRELALTTSLTAEQLLQEVGLQVSLDQERKYRNMINFWRWHARRKQVKHLPSHQGEDLTEGPYRFVSVENVQLLSYRNYLYRKYKTEDGCSLWRCRKQNCPSRVRLLPDRSLLSVSVFSHDHPEEEVQESVEQVDVDIKEQLRELALNTEMDVSDMLSVLGVEKNPQLEKFVTNLRSKKMRAQRQRQQPHQEDESAPEEGEDVVLDVPKDIVVLQHLDEDGEEGVQRVLALESMFQVVDEDGNEKTILVKQDGDCEELSTFYVDSTGEQTFILNE